LPQATLNTQIVDSYEKLKALLVENRYSVTTENAPRALTTAKGSLWGTTPKTAKKKFSYILVQNGQQTQIRATAQLAPSYVYFTVAGYILSLALLFVCVWIAVDLQGTQGFWSWLAQVGSQFDAQKAVMFTVLTSALAVFLAVSLVVETFIVWKARRGVGQFAEDALGMLQERVEQAASEAKVKN
jgi:hypothetical protein